MWSASDDGSLMFARQHVSEWLVDIPDRIVDRSPPPFEMPDAVDTPDRRRKRNQISTPASVRALQRESKKSKQSTKSEMAQDMKFGPYPVESQVYFPGDSETFTGPVPSAVVAFTEFVDGVIAGRGVIPIYYKQSVAGHIKGLSDAAFYEPSVSRPGGEVSYLPVHKLVRITRQTLEMKSARASEAGWNCAVHYPLLAEALDTSSNASAMHLYNLTIADMGNDLPQDWPKRRIDFSYAMQLYPRQLGAVRATGLRTFNCTGFFQSLDTPLAIAIETKADSGDMDEARLQLISWMRAHVATLGHCLRRLGVADPRVPTMPTIAVHGSAWYMQYMEDCLQNGVYWTPNVVFGDTGTLMGCFQVIRVMRHLVDWVHTTYREWFVANILDRLLPGVDLSGPQSVIDAPDMPVPDGEMDSDAEDG